MPGLQRRYWFGAMASLGVIVALSLASPSSSGGAVSPARVRAAVAWAPMEGEIIVAGTFVGVLTVAVTVIQLVVMTVRPATPGDERAIRHETPNPRRPIARPRVVAGRRRIRARGAVLGRARGSPATRR